MGLSLRVDDSNSARSKSVFYFEADLSSPSLIMDYFWGIIRGISTVLGNFGVSFGQLSAVAGGCVAPSFANLANLFILLLLWLEVGAFLPDMWPLNAPNAVERIVCPGM